MGAELLKFDLGFEAVLGFHHHVHQFVAVFVPFLDTTEVAGAAFVVDDKWHHAVAQTFLKQDESADAAVSILEGENLLKPNMEIQDMIPLDLSLVLVACDQFSQTGMDLPCREELAVTLSVGDIFMDVVHEYPDITIHLTLFNATISQGTPQKIEHNDIQWITPAQIPDYDFCPADTQILQRIREVYHG